MRWASTFGAYGIHAVWGLSDSSGQFLFLSGFVLASVFTLKAQRDGEAAAARDSWRRAARLWVKHMALFLLFGAMILWAERALPLPGEGDRLAWGLLATDPVTALWGAATLLYLPNYIDVLPVFILAMLALPGFLWLVARCGALGAGALRRCCGRACRSGPGTTGPGCRSGSIRWPGNSSSCSAPGSGAGRCWRAWRCAGMAGRSRWRSACWRWASCSAWARGSGSPLVFDIEDDLDPGGQDASRPLRAAARPGHRLPGRGAGPARGRLDAHAPSRRRWRRSGGTAWMSSASGCSCPGW